MISFQQARETVLVGCSVSGATVLEIDDALGCVLAEDVVSDVSVPPFDNSSVDGYAVRSTDVGAAPVTLASVGTVMAGDGASVAVTNGQAVRIMTGAPIPEGADAVCMIEDVQAGGTVDTVVIRRPLERGDNIRMAGEDVMPGQVVFTSGTVLGPAHVGVLASLGKSGIRVHPRLRVGVLSTGDELTSGSGELAPGSIRDSNRHILLAQIRLAGFDGVDLGVVGDDEDTLARAIIAGAETCDALVTSGGVSVGDRDVVKAVLPKVTDGAMHWMQIAIKPAKPLAFGVVAGTRVPVFGLPGNPVSAMVSFELFARPGLRRIAGFPRIDRPIVAGVAASPLVRTPDGKVHFLRVHAHVGPDGMVQVSPVEKQQSHHLYASASANALAIVPDGFGVSAGERVQLLLIAADDLAGSLDEAVPVRITG